MRALLVLATLWLSAGLASADQLPDSARNQLRLFFFQTKDLDDLRDAAQTDLVSTYIFERIVRQMQPERIGLDTLRRDLHLGSFGSQGGGTSIVARPSVSDLLSAAMELGSAVRKTDDSAATFTLNALPVRQVLSGQRPRGCGTLDEACRRGFGRWLRGLSGSMSLRASTPTTPVPDTLDPDEGASPAFLTGGRQLQSIALRYELLVRERDAAAQATLEAAAKTLTSKVSAALQAEAEFQTKLGEALAAWTPGTIRLLEENAGSLDRLETVLLERYRLAWELARHLPAIREALAATVPERIAYIQAQNEVLAEKLYRRALTVDYLHERPMDQPRLHQLRLVLSTPIGGAPNMPLALASDAVPRAGLTLNGGVTFYGGGLEGADPGRLRDAQASVALDWAPSALGPFRPTYTLAYYFQYMIANGVVTFDREARTPGSAAIPLVRPAVELLDTTGAIHVTQVRVSFKAGPDVSFPLAVSYANRSELVTGRSFWQGHIGVSYDFKGLLRREER